MQNKSLVINNLPCNHILCDKERMWLAFYCLSRVHFIWNLQWIGCIGTFLQKCRQSLGSVTNMNCLRSSYLIEFYELNHQVHHVSLMWTAFRILCFILLSDPEVFSNTMPLVSNNNLIPCLNKTFRTYMYFIQIIDSARTILIG